MRVATSLRFMLVLPFLGHAPSVHADQATDLAAAFAKWRAAGVRSYSFTYQWAGAVVIAPKCAGARIRVVVREGVGQTTMVVRGTGKCPRGLRGATANDLNVPATIEVAFENVRRHVLVPPTRSRVTATYDSALGFPTTYYAEKLEIPDNDEGFRIGDFKVLN